jgi:hypothetical protein
VLPSNHHDGAESVAITVRGPTLLLRPMRRKALMKSTDDELIDGIVAAVKERCRKEANGELPPMAPFNPEELKREIISESYRRENGRLKRERE